MAKGNSNAAENLEPTPPLEVIDNSAQVLKPNEVEALLEEFAKKNDQEASEPEAEADLAPEPELEASEPVIEETQPESVEVFEPDSVAVPEPQIESGPAFTMDDVLKAASEATSFSVDEIKKFDLEPGEDDQPDAFEDLLQPHQEMEVEEVSEHVATVLDDSAVAPRSKSAVKVKKDKAPRKKVAFSMPKLPFVGNPQAFVGPVLVAASVGASIWFLGGQIGAVDAKLTARQDKLEKSMEDTAAVLDSVSQRMADLDRSLDKSSKPTAGPKSTKVEPSNSEPKPGGSAPTMKPKAHTTESQGTNAEIGKKPSQSASTHSKVASKPSAKANPAPPAKRKSDPQVAEGFQVQRELLIAPNPNRPKGKARIGSSATKRASTARRAAPAPKNQNTVRVYLNGRLVHPKKSN